jgi:hypothetical protein
LTGARTGAEKLKAMDQIAGSMLVVAKLGLQAKNALH